MSTSDEGRQAGASLQTRRLTFSAKYGVWAFIDGRHIRMIAAEKSSGADRLDPFKAYDVRALPSKADGPAYFTVSTNHPTKVNPVFLAPRLFDGEMNPIEVDAESFTSIDTLLIWAEKKSADLATCRQIVESHPGEEHVAVVLLSVTLADELIESMRRIVGDSDMRQNRFRIWSEFRSLLDQLANARRVM